MPPHDFKKNKSRAVAVVGSAFIEKVGGCLDRVEDDDRLTQNIERQDIGFILLGESHIEIFWGDNGYNAQMAEK